MTSVPKHDPETNKNPADHSGYKIGYGKPPLDSRWRKGQCPNRKGRGPRSGGEMESYGDLVVRNSNEKITIYENGTERCVPKRVHLATRVVNRGIAGDPEEEKILIKFERPDLRPPAGARHIVDVDSEDEIPARERELRRRKPRANTGAPSLAKFAPGRPRHDAPFGELIKRELINASKSRRMAEPSGSQNASFGCGASGMTR